MLDLATPIPFPFAVVAGAETALAHFIMRMRTRTGTDVKLDRVYVSKQGNLKAVISNSMQRWPLRWSQDRWKKAYHR